GQEGQEGAADRLPPRFRPHRRAADGHPVAPRRVCPLDGVERPGRGGPDDRRRGESRPLVSVTQDRPVLSEPPAALSPGKAWALIGLMWVAYFLNYTDRQ